MDAVQKNLLYHTEVRWLSRGNVLKRFVDLKDETVEFLKLQTKMHWLDFFDDKEWISKLCYLCDIFERLNTLNTSLQGDESNIMNFVDKLSAFQVMLDLWDRKINAGRLAMFSHLCSYCEDNNYEISESLKNDIASHLHSLKNEFSRYFPEIAKSQFALVRNPFQAKMDDCVPHNNDAAQEEFIKLINDSGAKDLFARVNLSSFCSAMLVSYPIISEIALKLLIPFPSTYLCESASSSMLVIKTKARNRLELEADLRCCLSVTQFIYQ